MGKFWRGSAQSIINALSTGMHCSYYPCLHLACASALPVGAKVRTAELWGRQGKVPAYLPTYRQVLTSSFIPLLILAPPPPMLDIFTLPPF